MGVAPLYSKRRAWSQRPRRPEGRSDVRNQNENAWRIKPAALGWLK